MESPSRLSTLNMTAFIAVMDLPPAPLSRSSGTTVCFPTLSSTSEMDHNLKIEPKIELDQASVQKLNKLISPPS